MQLTLNEVTKKFGDFTANDRVSLTVEPHQIHCLLGENGAGKSTLMNVLYGLYEPTSGAVEIDGEPVRFSGPGDAMAAGIGMVHQHFMLVPVFTVAENVALGHESTRGASLDLESTRARIREISERYGFAVDPDAVVEDLPVGVQQRVEIIKALVRYEAAYDDPETCESMQFAIAMNTLKVNGAEAVRKIVGDALVIVGISGFANRSPVSLARLYRDSIGPSVMVNNDRILLHTATMQLVSRGQR